MKIEFEINEAAILELAQTSSMEDLPKAIFYQARTQAVEQVVNQIKKDSLIQDTYYSGKEQLAKQVVDLVMSKISELIKDIVEKQFSSERIQLSINRHFETTFQKWIEEKVYERLEKVKKDIFIGSYGEIEAERDAEAKGYQQEIDRLSEQS